MTSKESNKEMKDEETPFNYEEVYRTKCTGLGALIGAIRADSDMPDVGQEESEEERRRRQDPQYLQQVCDFGSGPTFSKVHKTMSKAVEFTCEVCKVKCSSQSMYEQHLNGQKHQKKMKLRSIFNSDTNECKEQSPPETIGSSKSSKAVRLREMIMASKEAFIGLSYVQEVLSETRQSDYEPGYKCNMCDITCLGQSMFQHLVGYKHKMRYFETCFGWSQLNKTEATERAEELEKNKPRNVNDIKRVISDRLYPWPVGHEPWAASSKVETPNETASSVVVHSSENLLLKLSNRPVENDREAENVLIAVDNLISQLIKYKISEVSERQKNGILSCGESLMSSLKTVMSIPTAVQEDQLQAQDGILPPRLQKDQVASSSPQQLKHNRLSDRPQHSQSHQHHKHLESSNPVPRPPPQSFQKPPQQRQPIQSHQQQTQLPPPIRPPMGNEDHRQLPQQQAQDGLLPPQLEKDQVTSASPLQLKHQHLSDHPPHSQSHQRQKHFESSNRVPQLHPLSFQTPPQQRQPIQSHQQQTSSYQRPPPAMHPPMGNEDQKLSNFPTRPYQPRSNMAWKARSNFQPRGVSPSFQHQRFPSASSAAPSLFEPIPFGTNKNVRQFQDQEFSQSSWASAKRGRKDLF